MTRSRPTGTERSGESIDLESAVSGPMDQRPAAFPLAPLALLFGVVLLIYASTYLLLSVLPVHLRDLGSGETIIGWILGSFSVAALLVRPFAGVAADRIGRRPCIAVGGLLIGASCLGYTVPSPAVIFAARVGNGFGWGAVTAVAATVAVDLAPRDRRGTVLGLYGMTTAIALAVGPSIGQWLADWAGNSVAFVVASACGFGAAAGVLLLRAPAPPRVRTSGRLTLGSLVVPSALGPAGVLLCFMLIYGAVLFFIPLVTLDRGLGSAGPFFAAFAATLVLLRVLGGGVSDRMGRTRVIGTGLACSALATVLLAFMASRPALIVSAIVFGAAFGLIQPASQAWAVDRSPDHLRGSTLATVVAAQDLGISAGAILAGFTADYFGYAPLFLSGTALSFAGLVALAQVKRRGPLRAKPAGAAEPRVE